MNLVMTLLTRDEADVIDAQIAFHLHAGVDFVVATVNRSQDATAEILARYARAGVLQLRYEEGDDMRQDEWVARMARLAATERFSSTATSFVCNAGTILLDALVNDRPAVCVLYDEGAPPGESWAAKNVIGAHYRELVASGAFYTAQSFEEVVAGIERALAHPGELAEERQRVVADVVGEVDGHAAERVVDAIAGVAGTPATVPR